MRLIAFLQSWDLLRGELGRPPTLADYARRFGLSGAAAERDRAIFDAAFPEQTPDEVLDLLWRWRDATASRAGGRTRASPPAARPSRR